MKIKSKKLIQTLHSPLYCMETKQNKTGRGRDLAPQVSLQLTHQHTNSAASFREIKKMEGKLFWYLVLSETHCNAVWL